MLQIIVFQQLLILFGPPRTYRLNEPTRRNSCPSAATHHIAYHAQYQQLSAMLFPHEQDTIPHIPTSTLKPNYVSILEFQDKLVENATAILYNRNVYGHLVLVVDDQEYFQATNHVWVDQVDPGLNPTIPNQATAAQIQEHIRQHNEAYTTFITTSNLLRNMIVNSIDDKYINALKPCITKYSEVEPIDLLNHLKDHYGKVTEHDLIGNAARMKTAWNTPTPIEVLWKQLKASKKIAGQGGETFLDAQMV